MYNKNQKSFQVYDLETKVTKISIRSFCRKIELRPLNLGLSSAEQRHKKCLYSVFECCKANYMKRRQSRQSPKTLIQ